ncbi:MAG: GspH/FimT family pseudopilin [Gammaproteobacteria bacterium]|nr:GspH/FimT family pseudopilin [Gammaproteobacteria bacterium]
MSNAVLQSHGTAFRNRGFTLIELTVIIIVISVLAVTAYGRFTGGDSFEARGARDELASAFRLAQRYAVTSGCWTQVTVNSGDYTVLMENTPCDGAGGFGVTITSPGSGSLSGSFGSASASPTGSYVYDAYGDLASGGGTITLSSNGSTASFTVQPDSGFVDLP